MLRIDDTQIALRLGLEMVNWKFREAWRWGMLGEISIVSFSQLPSLKILKSHSQVIPPLLLALIFPFLF